MKKVICALYILWAVLGILAIIFYGNYWFGLSFLWAPFVVAMSLSVSVLLIGGVGNVFKKKLKQEEERPSCGNCIFGATVDLLNQFGDGEKEMCLGEKEGYSRGVPCPHYIHK